MRTCVMVPRQPLSAVSATPLVDLLDGRLRHHSHNACGGPFVSDHLDTGSRWLVLQPVTGAKRRVVDCADGVALPSPAPSCHKTRRTRIPGATSSPSAATLFLAAGCASIP